VVARIAAAHYANPDDLIDSLAAKIGTDDPPLAVGLDSIEDPRNMGSILRTAECAGVHGVFIPERRATGLTDVVAKVAAGALEYVPVARVTNLVRLIEELKERNIWVVGATGSAAQPYTDWDWNLPVAVILGNEGRGLHRLVSERCDALVKIPVNGQIESLNVAVAAGVLLYEARRQRAMKAKR
jgi:23S rRNA (guanosine2251-2'-O)-methyltransferase